MICRGVSASAWACGRCCGSSTVSRGWRGSVSLQSARGDERMAAYREELLARIVGVIGEGREESVSRAERGGLAAYGGGRRGRGRLDPEHASRRDGAAGGTRVTQRRAGRRPSQRSLRRVDGVDRPALPRAAGRPGGTRPSCARRARAARRCRSRRRAANRADATSRSTLSSHGPRSLRMTYRTALVLEAIAQAPGVSNLGVARHAQVNDQGQISKLLSRLERNGLVQNTGRGQTQGAPNEWRLTPAGEKRRAKHPRSHPRSQKAGRMTPVSGCVCAASARSGRGAMWRHAARQDPSRRVARLRVAGAWGARADGC